MSKRICSVEDCELGHYGRGYCSKHYQRWRKSPELSGGACAVEICERPALAGGICAMHRSRMLDTGTTDARVRPPRATCGADGCEVQAHVRGLCQTHRLRFDEHGDPLGGPPIRARRTPISEGSVCGIEGCGRPQRSRTYCGGHYARLVRSGHLDVDVPIGEKRPVAKCIEQFCPEVSTAKERCAKHYKLWRLSINLCSIDDCGRPVKAQKLCVGHRSRLREFGDPLLGPPIREKSKRGQRRPLRTADGYVLVWANGHPNAQASGYILEHVKVMSLHINRALLPGENVHHLNGVKDDNRPENLELWVTMQPTGQRPGDLVLHAQEILERYGDLIAQPKN